MDYHFSIAARALHDLAADLPDPSATAVCAITLAIGAIVEGETQRRAEEALRELRALDGQGEPETWDGVPGRRETGGR